MPNPPLPRTRLYADAPLSAGAVVSCDEKRAHYLLHVLRLREGTDVVLFNGRDGEWIATIDKAGKKSASLTLKSELRKQLSSPDLWLLCTPLKNSRTDWVAEKATELGVSRIIPVTTRFTTNPRVNETRLRAIAVEAAEQCERMDIPQIDAITSLEKILGSWPTGRALIYGDESGAGVSPQALASALTGKQHAVLIGPEGGFAQAEFEQLRSRPFTKAITLGPRILRADTAAIAALTLVQAATGDFDSKPAFRNQENN